jgi:hypothetical protein
MARAAVNGAIAVPRSRSHGRRRCLRRSTSEAASTRVPKRPTRAAGCGQQQPRARPSRCELGYHRQRRDRREPARRGRHACRRSATRQASPGSQEQQSGRQLRARRPRSRLAAKPGARRALAGRSLAPSRSRHDRRDRTGAPRRKHAPRRREGRRVLCARSEREGAPAPARIIERRGTMA